MLEKVNALTELVIGCAICVHKIVGPGLLERYYETALGIELASRGITFERQVHVPVFYKGAWIGDYRVDVIVDNTVIVEIKSVERADPLFEAQVLAYLRASGKPVGLLINFNSQLLRHGVRRFINSHWRDAEGRPLEPKNVSRNPNEPD